MVFMCLPLFFMCETVIISSIGPVVCLLSTECLTHFCCCACLFVCLFVVSKALNNMENKLQLRYVKHCTVTTEDSGYTRLHSSVTVCCDTKCRMCRWDSIGSFTTGLWVKQVQQQEPEANHSHLTPRLRSGALPQLPQYPCMAWTSTAMLLLSVISQGLAS
jgi:hypothetical protein